MWLEPSSFLWSYFPVCYRGRGTWPCNNCSRFLDLEQSLLKCSLCFHRVYIYIMWLKIVDWDKQTINQFIHTRYFLLWISVIGIKMIQFVVKSFQLKKCPLNTLAYIFLLVQCINPTSLLTQLGIISNALWLIQFASKILIFWVPNSRNDQWFSHNLGKSCHPISHPHGILLYSILDMIIQPVVQYFPWQGACYLPRKPFHNSDNLLLLSW